MKLAASQPYFFPYIGYFQLIKAVDKFILYDHLSYIRHGWIERNRIAMPDSKELFIKVPLKKRSPNKLIREIEIDNSLPWQTKLLKQLRCNYMRKPFFSEIYPFVENLLTKEYDRLTDFNCDTIAAIASLLNIQTTIVCGGDDYLSVEDELKMKKHSCETKTQRIVLLCRKENADTYVNAIGGQLLYSKEEFEKQGIHLLFLRTDKYARCGSAECPTPYLSVIDVLFNYGVNGTKDLLGCYELL